MMVKGSGIPGTGVSSGCRSAFAQAHASASRRCSTDASNPTVGRSPSALACRPLNEILKQSHRYTSRCICLLHIILLLISVLCSSYGLDRLLAKSDNTSLRGLKIVYSTEGCTGLTLLDHSCIFVD